MLSLPDHDHHDSAWNRAINTADHYDPFCCRTEWQLSFHEVMGRKRELRIAEDRGSLVAFAISQTAHSKRHLEPVESSWMFGCPLLGPDAVPLLSTLANEHPKSNVVLSGLKRGDPLTESVLKTFQPHYDMYLVDNTTACRASLAGGIDGYLSRRSAKVRRGIRNAARRATAKRVSFERHAPTSTADAEAVYARMIAVEDQSWKGIGNCGMTKPPSIFFYAAMMRRMSSSGLGRIMFARHENNDIGFIFGGLCGAKPKGGIYRGQQFSFLEEWRSSSIGNLLQLEQLQWLAEEGVARYDMGPLMDYKNHWTEIQVEFETIAMRPR